MARNITRIKTRKREVSNGSCYKGWKAKMLNVVNSSLQKKSFYAVFKKPR